MPWTDASTPFDGGQVYGVCWDPDNSVFVSVGQDVTGLEVVMISSDGINWFYQPSPLDAGGIGYGCVRCSPHGVTVAVGSAPTIITSPDNVTWTDRGNPFVAFGAAYGVAVRASDDAILLAGNDFLGDNQLAISTDSGLVWTLYAPFAGVGVDVAVRASDDLLLVVGAGFSTYYAAVSTDSGATWTGSKPFGNRGTCVACAVRESDGALVVAGAAYSSNVALMAISTDSGATWTTHQPFGATAGSFAAGIGVDNVGGSDFVVVLGNDATHTHQLAYSTDSGATWTSRAPFGTGARARAATIVFDGSGNFYVAGSDDTENKQFAFANSPGAAWSTYQPLGPSQGVGYGIALGGPHGVIVSGQMVVIGGPWNQVASAADLFWSSWTRTSPFGGTRVGGGIAVRTSDGAVVVAGTPGAANTAKNQGAISTDGGATWTTFAPFNTIYGSASAVGCNQSSGVVLVGSSAGAGYSVARSIDGTLYVAISTPLDLGVVGGIDYSPGEDRWMIAGQVFGAAVVAYSDDDGGNWTVTASPMDVSNAVTPSVHRDEANGNWYLLGQTTGGNALAVSSDNGATWTEVATPLDPVAGVGQANAMVNADGTLALAGWDASVTKQMCSSFDDGATWVLDSSTPAPFGDGGAAYAVAYSTDLDVAAVAGIA